MSLTILNAQQKRSSTTGTQATGHVEVRALQWQSVISVHFLTRALHCVPPHALSLGRYVRSGCQASAEGVVAKPPPRSAACCDLANAFCALGANDGLARLRLMLLLLNPVNYTLLALQLYAQIRALAQVWRRPRLAQSIVHTRTALQRFDPNTFDPWVSWTVLPMLVNCSFLLLGWIYRGGGGGSAKPDGVHLQQSHVMEG